MPILFLLKKEKLIRIFTFLSLLALAMLSFYHLLIQAEIVGEFCKISTKVNSIEDFKNMLNTTQSCKNTSWHFLGLPISCYNLLLSITGILFLTLEIRKFKISTSEEERVY
ncbi:MAG: disulfide bond formation protein B [Parachlamydiaceae bacterium]